MSAPTLTRRSPFASPEWLEAAARLPEPPAHRDTIAFRLEFADGPVPGGATALDTRVSLDGGTLAVRPASGPEPGLVLRLPREAALALLLGSGLERARVVERGDVVAVGNFSLLFFVDAALQEDRSGAVARLRARTETGDPGLGPVTAPAVVLPDVDVDTDRIEEAAEALPRTVREIRREVGRSTPGALLYVSAHGVPLADFGIGLARPGVPMSHTSFPLWYCCAKPLLSVAFGQLREQGRFDPDRAVADYLPGFGSHGKEAITSIQLLTHTGPVATGDDPLHGVVTGPDDVKRRLALELPVAAGAGSGRGEIRYSQWWAWFVLSQVLTAIDGRDYDTYVREEILRPCAMDDTLVRLAPGDFDRIGDQLPLIHVTNPGGPAVPTHWWSTRAATTRSVPGVNTRGPLRDQGRLFEMLLAGGEGRNGRVLRPETVEWLTGRHRTGVQDRYGNADLGIGFRLECRSLGEEFVSFGHHVSDRAYGHDGLWTAVVFADPATGVTVALHLNGKIEHAVHRERVLRIADAIYTDLGHDRT